MFKTVKIQGLNNQKRDGREHFIDFLKTLAIIFIIIDNAAICWVEGCGLSPANLKLLYGECFWNGQGVPIFLFISGWLFVKWAQKNKATKIKQCYEIRTVTYKYLRFIIPILFAFFVKMIIMGCVDGWGPNIFFGLYNGTGSYYISIVLQLVVVCPLIYFLIVKLNIFGLAICFLIATAYDILCWGIQLDEGIYKQFIIRFIFMIGAGIYVCKRVGENKKYQWHLAIPAFVIGLTLLIFRYYFGLPMHVDTRWYQDCTLANLYAIPVLSILVRHFKMKGQKWWTIIGRSTFNIFLCQNILFTFPKQTIITDIFPLQLLFNETIALTTGLIFWFVENKVTYFLCKKIKKTNLQHKKKKNNCPPL